MELCGLEGSMEDGFEESAGLGLGGGKLGFQAAAEGHQLVDFGDDVVLPGESCLAGAGSAASSLLRKARALSVR